MPVRLTGFAKGEIKGDGGVAVGGDGDGFRLLLVVVLDEFRDTAGLEGNVPGARVGGCILDKDLGLQAIALVGKAGGGGLEHERFLHGEAGDFPPEACRPMMSHGNDPVTGQGIRGRELYLEATIPGGGEGGHPDGTGIEVLPHLRALQVAEEIFATSSNEEALVEGVALGGILREDITERSACLRAQTAGCVEQTDGIRIGVTCYRKSAFVFSINGYLGPTDGVARMVTNEPFDGDLLARAVVVPRDLQFDPQALLHDLDGQFAVTKAKDGLLVLAQVVLRSLDDEDGDERVGSVLVGKGYFHHRVFGGELFQHVAMNPFTFEGHEGGSLDGRLHEDAGSFSRAVAFLLGNELDEHAVFVGPGIFLGAVDPLGDGGPDRASVGIATREGKDIVSRMLRLEG